MSSGNSSRRRTAAGASDRPQGESATRVVWRGLRLSPEFFDGITVTLLLAVVATVGRVVVPIAVQQTIDRGLNAPGGPDTGFVRLAVAVCAVTVVVTMLAAYAMNVRLYRASEAGLSTLRVKAFRHVHDLSVLSQNAQRRGSLVSRVTGDIDQVSMFVQHGGLLMIVTGGQLVVASALMFVYSWQLALLVWACFAPLVVVLPKLQRRMSAAYTRVREHMGDLLAAVSEAVMGASVIRAYGVEDRTAARVDEAIGRHYRAQIRAQALSVLAFSSADSIAAVANCAVVLVGVALGIGGAVTTGQLLAFLFIVTLFVAPMRVATEVLNQAQRAIAGWRRVLEVLDTPPEVVDPGESGVELPRGPIDVRFERVSYAYPDGPTVLHDVDESIEPGTRVAVVGETGSGKTTFAKLLTRLMDPVEGRVLIDGVALPEVTFSSLRRRVVMVPQDGFLFDTTVAENIRYGRPGATDEELTRALTELGLADWAERLPGGLDTPVGQRGDSLSAGERQLVALARAYVADPDLLVLDEATSAVDPATEMRLQRALESLTRGRTAISIAHRLTTAETADEVLVFDAGKVVQRGPHSELVRVPGVYGDLHASWSAQSVSS